MPKLLVLTMLLLPATAAFARPRTDPSGVSLSGPRPRTTSTVIGENNGSLGAVLSTFFQVLGGRF